jgi:hypothetical protein
LIVRSHNLEPVEFYDLKTDPNELDNKVKNPSLDHIRKELINNHIIKVLKEKKVKS